jgi:hypothetical protein
MAGPLTVLNETVCLRLDHVEIVHGVQQGLNRLLIKLAVRLCPRTPDSRALAPIEHPELYARLVCSQPHQSTHGVDFAHQVAFAKPANGGIAGHHADALALVRNKRGPRAHTRRCRGRFAPGMPTADDNDIIFHNMSPEAVLFAMHPMKSRLKGFT